MEHRCLNAADRDHQYEELKTIIVKSSDKMKIRPVNGAGLFVAGKIFDICQ